MSRSGKKARLDTTIRLTKIRRAQLAEWKKTRNLRSDDVALGILLEKCGDKEEGGNSGMHSS